MATFLELVNLARSEAGIAGGDLSTLQSGLSAESTRFKTWVANEWTELQGEHTDWQFLRVSNQFDTVANQAQYTPSQANATDTGLPAGNPILAEWKVDSFRASTSGQNYGDEMIMGFMPWDTYRNLYQYGQMRVQRARPVVFTVDPQKNLWFGIVPDGAYTIVQEYYRTPQALVADADVPLMPARFHNLVAYRALRAYGLFMSAPEVISRADEKISERYPMLCIDQLPPIMAGPPLA
jgi:hypothetical protein